MIFTDGGQTYCTNNQNIRLDVQIVDLFLYGTRRVNLEYGQLETHLPDLGPVVQSIVSLTSSLRRQLVKYMPTTLSNTLLFFVRKNVRIFCNTIIFCWKNVRIFCKILTFFQQKITVDL